MELSDRERIEKGARTNFELKRLYEKHRALEARLHELGRKSFLTKSEQQEERELKLTKLRGVERMLKLADDSPELAA
jgi:hypothetical protein